MLGQARMAYRLQSFCIQCRVSILSAERRTTVRKLRNLRAIDVHTREEVYAATFKLGKQLQRLLDLLVLLRIHDRTKDRGCGRHLESGTVQMELTKR